MSLRWLAESLEGCRWKRVVYSLFFPLDCSEVTPMPSQEDAAAVARGTEVRRLPYAVKIRALLAPTIGDNKACATVIPTQQPRTVRSDASMPTEGLCAHRTRRRLGRVEPSAPFRASVPQRAHTRRVALFPTMPQVATRWFSHAHHVRALRRSARQGPRR